MKVFKVFGTDFWPYSFLQEELSIKSYERI